MSYLNIIIPKDYLIIEEYIYEYNELVDDPLKLKCRDVLKNGDIAYIYNVKEDQEDLVKVFERQFLLWKMDLRQKDIDLRQKEKELLEDYEEMLYE